MRHSLVGMGVLLFAVVAAPFAHSSEIDQACRAVPSEMAASLAPYPAGADLERADPALALPSESAIPALVLPRIRDIQTASLFCYLGCLFCSEGNSWECSVCADCIANRTAESLGSATADDSHPDLGQGGRVQTSAYDGREGGHRGSPLVARR